MVAADGSVLVPAVSASHLPRAAARDQLVLGMLLPGAELMLHCEVYSAEGSERAMLAMLAHAAEQVEGVREAMPELVLRRSGWRVGCTLSVWAAAQLPECSARVEQALRHALLVHTGIPIQSVSLTIHELPIGAAAHMIIMEAP